MCQLCQNVMFSGGIPADSVEGVFDLLASTVGERVDFWPDGEINPERRGWIGAINNMVLTATPCRVYDAHWIMVALREQGTIPVILGRRNRKRPIQYD
nr:hypothetical protein [Brucella intermedia]